MLEDLFDLFGGDDDDDRDERRRRRAARGEERGIRGLLSRVFAPRDRWDDDPDSRPRGRSSADDRYDDAWDDGPSPSPVGDPRRRGYRRDDRGRDDDFLDLDD